MAPSDRSGWKTKKPGKARRSFRAPRSGQQQITAAGLDGSQAAAVRRLTLAGEPVAVLVAPAGTGKTTTLGAATRAWSQSGIPVVGLAPSARAAAELSAATGQPADTVAKFLHTATTTAGAGRQVVPPGGVVLVDEASMLGTLDLDHLIEIAARARAKVVLVGDPEQIGAVEQAGGMLAALAHTTDAAALTQVHRFHRRWEADASLAVRSGDRDALTPYLAAGRVHPADTGDDALDALFTQWQDETAHGKSVLMMARTRADVDALNDRARTAAQTTGTVHGPVLHHRGETEWRAGDVLRATRNDRRLLLGDGHVRNGDRFTVIATGPDGGLLVAQHDTGYRALLADRYVTDHSRYGWATTIDGAQGATVDVGLLLARPGLDRQHLYVGLTRGRQSNHVHLAPDTATEIDHHTGPPVASAGPIDHHRVLTDALGRSDHQTAAHTRLPTNRNDSRAEVAGDRSVAAAHPGPAGRAIGWPLDRTRDLIGSPIPQGRTTSIELDFGR